MKRYSILFLFLLSLVAISTTGCKKEGCTDPAANNFDVDAKDDDGSCTYDAATQSLKLMMHGKWGSSDFALDETITTDDGRSLKFSKASIYLSNFALESDHGGTPVEFTDDYFLFQGAMTTFDLGEVDAEHFHGISFGVGIDSVTNHGDPSLYPAENVLSSSNPNVQFWSWNSGYIFLKMEGMVDTSATMNGTMDFPFEFHIGTDNLYRTVELTEHFTVEADQDYTLHLNIDYKQILDGLDLRTENISHTMDNIPVAMQIANNVAAAITAH